MNIKNQLAHISKLSCELALLDINNYIGVHNDAAFLEVKVNNDTNFSICDDLNIFIRDGQFNCSLSTINSLSDHRKKGNEWNESLLNAIKLKFSTVKNITVIRDEYPRYCLISVCKKFTIPDDVSDDFYTSVANELIEFLSTVEALVPEIIEQAKKDEIHAEYFRQKEFVENYEKQQNGLPLGEAL